MTTRQKPELTDAQRAILNSAYDALGANPQDGWFTLEATPQITKAVKDGLLNHRENTKQYRISGKGLWMLGKEHPLKAKQAAIEKATEADEAIIANAHALLDSISVPLAIDPLRNEAQQARADLVGDGKIAPLAASVILSGVATSVSAAKADDLEQQLAEGQAEWEAEKALMQKRIADLTQAHAAEIHTLENRVRQLETGLTLAEDDKRKLTAERDEARAAALKFTEFASHWRAINALVEVEVSAPTSPGVYKGFPEPVEIANSLGAKTAQPAFGFLDGHNPAGVRK